MTRILPIISIAIVAITVALHGQDAQFRASTDVVPIYATAIDRSGRVVTDLTQDDFEILDNGVPQPISYFSRDAQPFSVVVMLDRSGSMDAHAGLIRRAALTFVRRMAPDDRARVGSFGNAIVIKPAAFTSDKRVLNRIIENELDNGGGSPVWTALDRSISALETEPGRRVVVLFSDGNNSDDRWDMPFTPLADVRQHAERAEVMIYTIGFTNVETVLPPLTGRTQPRFQRPPPGLPGSPGANQFPPGPTLPKIPAPAQRRIVPPNPALRELAEQSGGGYFELRPSDDLSALFAKVADELHRQYTIGFSPQRLDGGLHALDVHVRRPGVQIRARKSYIATAR
jgi:VWFA-related protein